VNQTVSSDNRPIITQLSMSAYQSTHYTVSQGNGHLHLCSKLCHNVNWLFSTHTL